MACDPTRSCAVTGQQLTAWVLEQPLIKTKHMYLIIAPGLNGFFKLKYLMYLADPCGRAV